MTGRTAEQRQEEELVPLVGRRDELKALTAAVRRRRSCLVTGPSGSGKTRLIEEALRASQQPAVRLPRPGVLHELLLELARQLPCVGSCMGDLRHATSAALKPVVQDALRTRPCCVVLDDVADTDPRMYRFLQQVSYIPGVSLIAGAKSRDSLGHLRKLLWDPREEISIKPLSRGEAAVLFEAACHAFLLDSLDVVKFKGKVLAAAQGNPGQIVTMCKMASRREYQAGRHILFLPLRMDALREFV